jgi:hypothetical protein
MALTPRRLLGRITIQDATFKSILMMHFTIERDGVRKKVWAEAVCLRRRQ